MFRIVGISCTFAVLMCFVCCATINSQDKSSSNKGASKQSSQEKKSKLDSDVAAAKATFLKISNLVKKRQYESAAKLMTKDEAKKFATSTVVGALGMVLLFKEFDVKSLKEEGYNDEMIRDIQAKMKQQFQTVKKIRELSKKFGLEKFQITGPLENITEKQVADFERKIETWLLKQDNRWEIVSAFHGIVETGFPQIWFAKFVSQKHDDGGLVVELKPDYSSLKKIMDASGDKKNQGPSIFVRFKKTKAGWRFDGVDDEKTAAAVEKFMDDNDGGLN